MTWVPKFARLPSGPAVSLWLLHSASEGISPVDISWLTCTGTWSCVSISFFLPAFFTNFLPRLILPKESHQQNRLFLLTKSDIYPLNFSLDSSRFLEQLMDILKFWKIWYPCCILEYPLHELIICQHVNIHDKLHCLNNVASFWLSLWPDNRELNHVSLESLRSESRIYIIIWWYKQLELKGWRLHLSWGSPGAEMKLFIFNEDGQSLRRNENESSRERREEDSITANWNCYFQEK